jgi:hypothetical protein
MELINQVTERGQVQKVHVGRLNVFDLVQVLKVFQFRLCLEIRYSDWSREIIC